MGQRDQDDQRGGQSEAQPSHPIEREGPGSRVAETRESRQTDQSGYRPVSNSASVSTLNHNHATSDTGCAGDSPIDTQKVGSESLGERHVGGVVGGQVSPDFRERGDPKPQP